MGLGMGSQVNFPRRNRIARIASALAEGPRGRCAMMSLLVGVALELGARAGVCALERLDASRSGYRHSTAAAAFA